MPRPFLIRKKYNSGSGSADQYQLAQQRYRLEGFSYNALLTINTIVVKAERLSTLPVRQVLIKVSKILLLNELQLLFLSYYMERDSWFAQHQLIQRYSEKLLNKIQVYPGGDVHFSKVLFLYLLLSGFCVKFFLNENVQIFKKLIERDYLSQFKGLFDQYAKLRAQEALKIFPKDLNMRYKQIAQEGGLEGQSAGDMNQLADLLSGQSSKVENEQKFFDFKHLGRGTSFDQRL